jgi:hypothetical protein
MPFQSRPICTSQLPGGGGIVVELRDGWPQLFERGDGAVDIEREDFVGRNARGIGTERQGFQKLEAGHEARAGELVDIEEFGGRRRAGIDRLLVADDQQRTALVGKAVGPHDAVALLEHGVDVGGELGQIAAGAHGGEVASRDRGGQIPLDVARLLLRLHAGQHLAGHDDLLDLDACIGGERIEDVLAHMFGGFSPEGGDHQLLSLGRCCGPPQAGERGGRGHH